MTADESTVMTANEEPAIAAKEEPAAKAKGGVPLRILAIDDHPSVLIAIEYFVSTLGYTVIPVRSGSHGIEIATEEGNISLVLLDIDMPVMNGYAVLEAFQAHPELRRIPVIMITGRMNRDVVARGLAAGARAVLAKPFDLQELQDEIAKNIASGLSGADASAPPAK